MRTIACLSQKGGVGKSTLARLVAVAHARRGLRVKIADFNVKQKTCVNWVAARLKAGHRPEIAAEPFSSVAIALKQADLYDLMVFDTRPDSDIESLAIARVSDLVLIPTGVTVDDLDPQIGLARELKLKGVKPGQIRFVITNPPNSVKVIDEARELITGRGFQVIPTTIPFRISYQLALDQGLALNEVSVGSFQVKLAPLNDRADAQAREIINAMKAMKEVA